MHDKEDRHESTSEVERCKTKVSQTRKTSSNNLYKSSCCG